jgi:hypothetical protein
MQTQWTNQLLNATHANKLDLNELFFLNMATADNFEIIKHLSKQEQLIVSEYLKKFKPIGLNKNSDYKEESLFEILIAEKNISDSELSKRLGVKRIDMLKTNLFSKITEALIQDKFITNSDIFSKNDQNTYKLKKQILAIRILYRNLTRDKTNSILKLLEELIKNSIKHEAYEITVEALQLKKYTIGIRLGMSEFEKINRDVEHYKFAQIAVYSATDDYSKFILHNEFQKKYSEKEIDVQLSNTIKRIQHDFKITNSDQVNYFLQTLILAQIERKKEYKKAIKQCNDMIKFIKNSEVVYRKERIGFILDYVSQFKVFLGDYKGAAIEAKKAQQYYLENSFHSLVSMEQEFYAHFYNNNFEKAMNSINLMLDHAHADSGQFRKSKFIYYKVCVLFKLNQFQQAWNYLKNTLEIETDKARWNIALRILNIQIFIELNKINEASRSLEALRKHIERNKKVEMTTKRDELIVTALRIIEKDGFQFNTNRKELIEYVGKLEQNETELSWTHYTTELIPFHIWLNSIKKIN